MIYARALTEIFQSNDDPKNGTAILTRILNRSYHSIKGYDVNCIYCRSTFCLLTVFLKVFIDQNGDAEGNFTIVSLLKDKEGQANMSMQPVGYFQFTSNGSVVSGLPVRPCITLTNFVLYTVLLL